MSREWKIIIKNLHSKLYKYNLINIDFDEISSFVIALFVRVYDSRQIDIYGVTLWFRKVGK